VTPGNLGVANKVDTAPFTDLDNEADSSPDECDDKRLLLNHHIQHGRKGVDSLKRLTHPLEDAASAVVALVMGLPIEID